MYFNITYEQMALFGLELRKKIKEDKNYVQTYPSDHLRQWDDHSQQK